MRRRRRPIVNWLPVPGVQPAPADTANRTNGFTFAIAVAADPTIAGGGLTTALTTLTFDFPGDARFQSSLAAGIVPSLRDYVQGSAYRLRRIVGKLSAQHRSTGSVQGPTSPPGVIFGAGFIVLKVDPDNGNPLSLNANDYSPLSAKNVEDPWIWRRVWHFGSVSQGDGSETNLLFGFSPDTNRLYGGGNNDGPHVDQKTARVIGPDERLFFVISTKALALLTIYNQGSIVAGYLDYRLLGSFVNKATSNRGNSSR